VVVQVLSKLEPMVDLLLSAAAAAAQGDDKRFSPYPEDITGHGGKLVFMDSADQKKRDAGSVVRPSDDRLIACADDFVRRQLATLNAIPTLAHLRTIASDPLLHSALDACRSHASELFHWIVDSFQGDIVPVPPVRTRFVGGFFCYGKCCA
jgi:hypothetical protein